MGVCVLGWLFSLLFCFWALAHGLDRRCFTTLVVLCVVFALLDYFLWLWVSGYCVHLLWFAVVILLFELSASLTAFAVCLLFVCVCGCCLGCSSIFNSIVCHFVVCFLFYY